MTWRWGQLLAASLILAGCVRTVDAEAVTAPSDIVPVSAFDGFFLETSELSQLVGQKVKFMGGYDEPAYGDDPSRCSAMVGFDGSGEVFGREFSKFRWNYYRNVITGRHPEYRQLLALWPDRQGAAAAMQRIENLLAACRSDPDNAMVKFTKTSGPVLTWRLEMVDGICAFDTRIWENLVYSAETCMTGQDEQIAARIAAAMQARIRGVT